MNLNSTQKEKKLRTSPRLWWHHQENTIWIVILYNRPEEIPPSNNLPLQDTNGDEQSLLRVSPACQPKEHRIVVAEDTQLIAVLRQLIVSLSLWNR
jgi:hypothetical protein